MTVIINVRHYSGSYIARGQGFKPTASHQRSAIDAAHAAAEDVDVHRPVAAGRDPRKQLAPQALQLTS